MTQNEKKTIILTSKNKIKIKVLENYLNNIKGNIKYEIKTVKIKPLVEQPIGIINLIEAAFHRLEQIDGEGYSLENGLVSNIFDLSICIHKYKNKKLYDCCDEKSNIIWKYKAFINFEHSVKLPKKYINIPLGKTIGDLLHDEYGYEHDNWQSSISNYSVTRYQQLDGAINGLSNSNEFISCKEIIYSLTNN